MRRDGIINKKRERREWGKSVGSVEVKGKKKKGC